jgi:hypothetical protein
MAQTTVQQAKNACDAVVVSEKDNYHVLPIVDVGALYDACVASTALLSVEVS